MRFSGGSGSSSGAPVDISGKLDAALVGAANGVASLDGATKIPVAQVPSITAAMVASDVATQAELDSVVSTVATKLDASARGAVNGVASLDGAIKVPAAQIPTITAAMVAADVATQAELDAVSATVATKLDASARGAVSGVASLDGSSKVPVAQIPTITAAMVAADLATQSELDAVAATVTPKADTTTVNSALALKADASLLPSKQDKTPVHKGYSRAVSYSHSIGKSGGGSFFSAGISAGADWRNQYPAKLSKLFNLPMDNRGVGGAQLTGVGFAAPNFGTVLQQVVSSTQTGPAFVARPGAGFYNFHFGANDQGFALANLSAFQHAYRACIARMLSDVNIEDSDTYVTTAGGAAGTTRTSADRNSGQSMRTLANTNAITISGGPLASTFPGGDAFIRFIVESGDVASVSIVVNGGSAITQDLSHVSPQASGGVAKINNRYDLVFGGTITGGTFTLTFGGATTGAITYSSNTTTMTANIQAALVALSSVGSSGSLPSGSSTIAAPANAAVYVTSDSVTAYSIKIDTPKIGAAGTNGMITATSSLTGTAPTVTVNKQAGPVVNRVSLPSGVNTITITAAVTTGSVKFDGIDIITTGSTPPTVVLPGLHRFIDSAQDTWFKGFATDAAIATWNTGLQSVISEFSSYPRVVWVNFDTLVNKSVIMLGTGAGGALGDGIHPLEPATRAMAKAVYQATPILTDDESVALGNEQVDWYDLSLLSPWVLKTQTNAFWPNQYKPQFRKDREGYVHLRGLVSSPSTAPSANTQIAQLPAGYRPLSALQGTMACDSGAAVYIVNVGPVAGPTQARSTDGGIYQSTGGTSGGWTDLSGIAPFFAEE